MRQAIESLQTATAGDRDLSQEVLQSLGWRREPCGCPGGDLWRRPDGALHAGPLPAVTEDPAAARDLVPAGLSVHARETGPGLWAVELYAAPATAPMAGPPLTSVQARTLPLALCGAALRARAAGA